MFTAPLANAAATVAMFMFGRVAPAERLWVYYRLVRKAAGA